MSRPDDYSAAEVSLRGNGRWVRLEEYARMISTLRAQLEAAEADWREKFEARTIDWSEASNALYVWRHLAKDAEARAEAAEANAARLGEVLDRIAGYSMSQFHSALDMASQCRTDAAMSRTKEETSHE